MPAGLLVRSEGGERVRAVRFWFGGEVGEGGGYGGAAAACGADYGDAGGWFGEMVVVMVKQVLCRH